MTNHYDRTGRGTVKASPRPRIVAVLASCEDLERAGRLRRQPDLYEIRLDALSADVAKLETHIACLQAPLIVTARHPREGGHNRLSLANRRRLLLRFLRHAAFVDVELRSVAQLQEVLDASNEMKIKRIVSVHHLQQTPPLPQLVEHARSAHAAGAHIFKLATRTETVEDVTRLIEFSDAAGRLLPISAMGIGRAGRRARVLLARAGSALNYAYLGTAQAEGQLSLPEMRRILAD